MKKICKTLVIFLHCIVEKGGFLKIFFPPIFSFFFLYLEVIFRFSCPLPTLTALRVFAEGFDGADICANCIGFLMSYYFMFTK